LEDVYSAKTLKEFKPFVIRLQLASLFGKIWEESSRENSPILKTKIFMIQVTSLLAWCRASQQVYVLFYKTSLLA
jgi:hypothetical protein